MARVVDVTLVEDIGAHLSSVVIVMAFGNLTTQGAVLSTTTILINPLLSEYAPGIANPFWCHDKRVNMIEIQGALRMDIT